MDTVEPTAVKNEMACTNCGALLKFKPGTMKLTCEYCHAENEIAKSGETNIIENDLDDFLARYQDGNEKIEITTIHCDSCGATSTVDPKIASDRCPFCATTFVLQKGSSSKLYKPQYLLPFGIDDRKALENFKRWLKSLWFAPNELANYVDRADRLSGMYLPFWTFDCNTSSTYTGERGVDYTVTESYTNSKGERETRSVTRTNWYPASGNVTNLFDDLLIEGSRSLRKDKLRALEPWDLKNVVAYDDKYLSGFRTETFQVDLPTAYEEGKGRMREVIIQLVKRDIGGDRQQVHSVSTTYKEPKFKYVLLPVWLSAYKYKNKVYQFIINARTGEVQGERPYSAFKIALAVIAAIIIAIVLYTIANN